MLSKPEFIQQFMNIVHVSRIAGREYQSVLLIPHVKTRMIHYFLIICTAATKQVDSSSSSKQQLLIIIQCTTNNNGRDLVVFSILASYNQLLCL